MNRYVLFAQFIEDFFDGQPDDVAPEAVYALDNELAMVLNAIGARFVQGTDQLEVVVDVGIREVAEVHGGTGYPGAQNLTSATEGDTSQDVMRTTRERTKHPLGIRQIAGLAVDLFSLNHDGVGGQNQLIGMTGGHFAGFGNRQNPNVVAWRGNSIPGGL